MPFPNIAQFLLIILLSVAHHTHLSNQDVTEVKVPVQSNPRMALPPVSHDPDDITFYLFHSKKESTKLEVIPFMDEYYLTRSSLIANASTVIIIPGAEPVFSPDDMLYLLNEYANSDIHGNFIAVDWDKLNNIDGPKEDCPAQTMAVMQNFPILVKRVTDMICWLVDRGMISLDKIHLIGGSVGAQLVGKVATQVSLRSKGEKVQRITGLDPAADYLDPPFSFPTPPKSGDARFVELYHSNVGFNGLYSKHEADVDIYVNDGIFQPGCLHTNLKNAGLCSHRFAIWLYAAAFRNSFLACGCPPYRRLDGWCQTPCTNPTIIGPYISERARGSFEIRTGPLKPNSNQTSIQFG